MAVVGRLVSVGGAAVIVSSHPSGVEEGKAGLAVAVRVGEGRGVRLGVAVRMGRGVRLGTGDAVSDGVMVAVGETVGEADGEPVEVAVGEHVGLLGGRGRRHGCVGRPRLEGRRRWRSRLRRYHGRRERRLSRQDQ